MIKKQDTPQVDCIIPCHNDGMFALRAVQSILDQGTEPLRVIVVNDGSTDGSAELLQTIRDSRVTIIEQCNQGPAAARNRGIRASRAPLCAFLDADDVWLPGKLRLQMEALERAPARTVGHCVSFRQIRPDGSGRNRRMPPPDQFRDHLFDVCMTTIGSTLLVRRSAFDQVGLFNEAMLCFEDWDWQIRCLLHGLAFDTSPEALVVKQEGGRRSGPVVETACRKIGEHLPAVAAAFGPAAARRLRSAMWFEQALSRALQHRWPAAAGSLAASLYANPRRLGYLARRLRQRFAPEIRPDRESPPAIR